MNNNTQIKSGLSTLGLGLVVLLAFGALNSVGGPGTLARSEGNPNVLPPNQQGIYMQLQADWWQWVLALPAAENPLLDTTGAAAANGQQGDIWFLAGTPGGAPVTRNVVIPPGKSLFFPVVNYVYIHNLKEDPKNKDQRAMIGGVIDAVANLACEIDGKPVNNLAAYRFQSSVFKLRLAADNIYAAYGLEAGDWPSVDDGYYLLLAPLSTGNHTIHFHAEFPWAGGTVDTTYHLTVQ